MSDLTGNSKKHLEVLKANYTQSSCSGEPSLQNGLELALSSLKHMPTHAIREVLIIMGSLTTCDPGDINTTIQVCIINQLSNKDKNKLSRIWKLMLLQRLICFF